MQANQQSRSVFTLPGHQVFTQYGVSGVPVPGASVAAPALERLAQARRASQLGEACYANNNFRQAILHMGEAVRLEPENAMHHLNLACATWLSGEMNGVEMHLMNALTRSPKDPSVLECLGRWYMQRGQMAKAIMFSRKSVDYEPRRVSGCVALAECLWADRQHNEAWSRLQEMVDAGAGGLALAVAYATMARKMGRQQQALDLIDRELSKPNVNEIERTRMLYVSVELLHSLGQYDKAFENAKTANIIKKRPYEWQAHERAISNRINYYTKDRIKALPRTSLDSSRTVLIVGMPRSGTSLVEQILTTHDGVYGAGELMYLYETTIDAEKAAWATGPFPNCWDDLSLARADELASKYLSRVAVLDRTSRYVTDKMPTNFLLLGAAQLLLPQCKVIHCRRDPRDSCLSCFITDFAAGNDFSTSIPGLAHYYRNYERLMAHWKANLDLPILDIQYEELVTNPEPQVRRMLEFLDLPWDEACLRHHENKRYVATASKDQVREPFYSSSIGRWKKYEKHIPELLALADEAK